MNGNILNDIRIIFLDLKVEHPAFHVKGLVGGDWFPSIPSLNEAFPVPVWNLQGPEIALIYGSPLNDGFPRYTTEIDPRDHT